MDARTGLSLLLMVAGSSVLGAGTAAIPEGAGEGRRSSTFTQLHNRASGTHPSPIENLCLWPDASGVQIWARWDNRCDISLLRLAISGPQGISDWKSFATIPRFRKGEKAYLFLFGEGGYARGTYRVEFTFCRGNNTSGVKEYIDVAANLEGGLYRGPASMDRVSLEEREKYTPSLHFTPRFSGGVESIAIYQDEVFRSWTKFSDPMPVRAGSEARYNLDRCPEHGARLQFLFLGKKKDGSCLYTVADVVAP